MSADNIIFVNFFACAFARFFHCGSPNLFKLSYINIVDLLTGMVKFRAVRFGVVCALMVYINFVGC